MALQGTLKDFSITEIIQLIGQQLKTGVLKIRRGKSLVEISFVDGMIVHVYSNYRGKKDLIGEILVKAQLITDEQLERVLKVQKETLKYIGEILVELGLLTKDDILKVITTQIYETIYELFWWEDGTFNFDLKLVESYKKIPFALSTEQVLLNILRMVDEWSEIEKKIFSPTLSFENPLGRGEISGRSLSSEPDEGEADFGAGVDPEPDRWDPNRPRDHRPMPSGEVQHQRDLTQPHGDGFYRGGRAPHPEPRQEGEDDQFQGGADFRLLWRLFDLNLSPPDLL